MRRDPKMTLASSLVLAQLAQGHRVPITCAGDSMSPTIARGQVVTVRGVRHPREVRRGDVILFALADGTLQMHRVVARLGKWVWHRGDYYKSPNLGRVRWADVHGVVFGYSRRLWPSPTSSPAPAR